MKKEDKKDVDFYVDKIRSALKSEGVYNETLDLAIDSCAQVYFLKDRVFEKIKNKQPTVKEISREGGTREKQNPAFSVFKDLTEIGRKMLVELSLTSRTSQSAGEDATERLTNAVNKILENDGEE